MYNHLLAHSGRYQKYAEIDLLSLDIFPENVLFLPAYNLYLLTEMYKPIPNTRSEPSGAWLRDAETEEVV